MAYESVFRAPRMRRLQGSASVLAIAALMAAVPHRASAQAQQPPLAVVTAEGAVRSAAVKAEAPLVLAQVTSADAGQSSQPVEEVTVTGSHIAGNGYQAVSPLTVLNTADIKAAAPANLSDYVNEIPALAGSVSPQTSNASISAGVWNAKVLRGRSLSWQRKADIPLPCPLFMTTR
jgi:hypothetical protein